jgi:urea carboxylase/allophanate hydrolase
LRRICPEEEGDGRKIQLEIWSIPESSYASFAATVAPPLAMGSVELEDGSWVRGPVCEPYDLQGATDITDFGGWKTYVSKHTPVPFPRRRIRRVLIANRGEIAVHIARTLRRMKIEAVAIYSDADAGTAHVHDADVALRLAGSSVAETYLNADQILALAKSVSADAIIPGYGFLAENAYFARGVEAEGMIWVGPTPEHMSELGLKHRARSIAAEVGVPIVPGSSGLVTSVEEAQDEARRIGFPLMLKSSAGGGGIGLRRCGEASELEEALQSVQRLASANFGDSSVFLERFIAKARHVEVQVLGDGTGRVMTAGERDCSLQRRHQKVVEESPALMVPTETRVQMRDAAMKLASAVRYLNVGTVEFLYDVDSQDFYFLEVNTRLQVEHTITEAVTGLDLVEAMMEIAADGGQELFQRYPDGIVPVTGVAIEARLYAEDPLQNFRPCAGRILELEFPLPDIRVDTWVSSGTEVSTAYDPMLARLIAKGNNRSETVARLAEGLAATRVAGLETNLDFLRQLVASPMFQSGCYTTKSLDDFRYTSASFRVVEPGSLTTIQDWPGRTGYWSVGVPPSGPIDDLSFRLSNRLVNNHQSCAGLECNVTGPSLTFHCDVVIAVVGASALVHINEKRMPMNHALRVLAGSTLKVGSVDSGARFYIAIRGGIDVPRVMGSRSTFELGRLGGFAGRKLQCGDLVRIGDLSEFDVIDDRALPVASAVPIPPQSKAEWTIGVVPGPHGAPDFFTVEGLASLFNSTWTVHYNSNRLGIRLNGPKPHWARQDGGEAGLHPSNVHDSPYSIGSVSFTGDDAVVLTCDGPSLGGFVVFCVVASAELWKLGQVRPGDTIRLRPLSVEKALGLNAELLHAVDHLARLPSLEQPEDERITSIPDEIVLGTIHHNEQRILARQAGDSAVLLEFGDASAFRLRQSFEILAFIQHHQTQKAIPGVEELTPGVCTLHVKYVLGTSTRTMLDRLALHVRSYVVPTQVPSRRVRLPLAFDDAVTRAAVERYAATIRADAPWLPSNVDFLAQLNGVERDALRDILESSEFLVLGLGDVYLGSPCAVPLDPRHRLFGTKYNPSRTFTPKGAVGIGGQYMCSESRLCHNPPSPVTSHSALELSEICPADATPPITSYPQSPALCLAPQLTLICPSLRGRLSRRLSTRRTDHRQHLGPFRSRRS